MDRPSINFADRWILKYRFRKLIGRGGFATVWLADETQNRNPIRPVAIKVFVDRLDDRASFQKTFESFQQDLQFLADLAPDNPIIQYFNSEMVDVFVDSDGFPYTLDSRPMREDSDDDALTLFLIVMEFADGGSLGDPSYREEVVVGRQGNQFLKHFIEITLGLKAAHAGGVVHRDIKPANLMWFRKRDRVKIGDFGIANVPSDAAADSFGLAGTPMYMSPEAFDTSVGATPERDIYALGCTFFEILTGERAIQPKESGSLFAWQEAHKIAQRPEAYVIEPNLVSVDLSALLKRMMATDPARRPDLSEVLSTLQAEEARSTAFDEEHIPSTSIPQEPVFLSPDNIHPEFRRAKLKETLIYVFITMNTQSAHRYRLLFSLLNYYFGKTYSISEIFGRYDFVVRVWTTRAKCGEFGKRVIDEILDDDTQSLFVMACDEIHYLGATPKSPREDLSLEEVLVRLNRAQGGGGDDTMKRAIEWLRRRSIYVRRLPGTISGNRVPSFCLVSHSDRVSQATNVATCALIATELKNSIQGVGRLALTLCRKAYQPVSDLENEPNDYLISFLAPNINQVATIPAVIADRLTDHRLRVSTFVASKRYFVQSDRVFPK